ncbi:MULTISPECIES: tRNA lysidine(34) synthetase TilS [Halomonadaceae]|uniref:tRNA lysidine(34) synthetase TilS n=1 Tax=Halomonadaceae TaxID=28256 RepID=UPI00200CC29A|nr:MULTISPECIES: tRNA lysidine(34) synthetase TilS [Halomonas]
MSLQALIDHALAETPPGRVVWVALSGGLDSSLLLTLAADACRRHPRTLRALHVNHGLQDAAGDFETHCGELCSRLGVSLTVERVQVSMSSGLGLEGAAREARYAAFARHVSVGDTVWLAQHRNDQAEGFLLAALRGSGVRGLAAMPASRDWQGRQLARPLLGSTRSELEREADCRRLSWVEDPSNAESALDRNFLRHRLLPLIETRWPGGQASLARSAAYAGEADALLEELAELDLAASGDSPGWLPLATLSDLSAARQRLLIRHCCTCLGLPPPPAARLATLQAQLDARRDSQVHVHWPGGEARLWRGALYLAAPRRSLEPDWQRAWDGQAALATPIGSLNLVLEKKSGGPVELCLRPRLGGETLQMTGRGRRDLKRLLQERGVPPWQRGQLVVAWHEAHVVAVFVPGEREPLLCAEGWRCRPLSLAQG